MGGGGWLAKCAGVYPLVDINTDVVLLVNASFSLLCFSDIFGLHSQPSLVKVGYEGFLLYINRRYDVFYNNKGTP